MAWTTEQALLIHYCAKTFQTIEHPFSMTDCILRKKVDQGED
jgi:hypothetical protein